MCENVFLDFFSALLILLQSAFLLPIIFFFFDFQYTYIGQFVAKLCESIYILFSSTFVSEFTVAEETGLECMFFGRFDP